MIARLLVLALLLAAAGCDRMAAPTAPLTLAVATAPDTLLGTMTVWYPARTASGPIGLVGAGTTAPTVILNYVVGLPLEWVPLPTTYDSTRFNAPYNVTEWFIHAQYDGDTLVMWAHKDGVFWVGDLSMRTPNGDYAGEWLVR